MPTPEYKPSFSDRNPDASLILQLWAYGLVISGLIAGVLLMRLGFHWWICPVALAAGSAAACLAWALTRAAGGAWTALMVDGNSTPYVEQYSYQQSLIMQGEVDQALASFEAIVAERPATVAPRIRVAELYARERQDPRRAAAHLRAAQRSPSITPGEDLYVTNRLVDLLAGPLADPGRACVELRRLIERHPRSAGAEHARVALRALKSRTIRTDLPRNPPAQTPCESPRSVPTDAGSDRPG